MNGTWSLLKGFSDGLDRQAGVRRRRRGQRRRCTACGHGGALEQHASGAGVFRHADHVHVDHRADARALRRPSSRRRSCRLPNRPCSSPPKRMSRRSCGAGVVRAARGRSRARRRCRCRCRRRPGAGAAAPPSWLTESRWAVTSDGAARRRAAPGRSATTFCGARRRGAPTVWVAGREAQAASRRRPSRSAGANWRAGRVPGPEARRARAGPPRSSSRDTRRPARLGGHGAGAPVPGPLLEHDGSFAGRGRTAKHAGAARHGSNRAPGGVEVDDEVAAPVEEDRHVGVGLLEQPAVLDDQVQAGGGAPDPLRGGAAGGRPPQRAGAPVTRATSPSRVQAAPRPRPRRSAPAARPVPRRGARRRSPALSALERRAVPVPPQGLRSSRPRPVSDVEDAGGETAPRAHAALGEAAPHRAEVGGVQRADRRRGCRRGPGVNVGRRA